jgi:hypothetical protein
LHAYKSLTTRPGDFVRSRFELLVFFLVAEKLLLPMPVALLPALDQPIAQDARDYSGTDSCKEWNPTAQSSALANNRRNSP